MDPDPRLEAGEWLWSLTVLASSFSTESRRSSACAPHVAAEGWNCRRIAWAIRVIRVRIGRGRSGRGQRGGVWQPVRGRPSGALDLGMSDGDVSRMHSDRRSVAARPVPRPRRASGDPPRVGSATRSSPSPVARPAARSLAPSLLEFGQSLLEGPLQGRDSPAAVVSCGRCRPALSSDVQAFQYPFAQPLQVLDQRGGSRASGGRAGLASGSRGVVPGLRSSSTMRAFPRNVADGVGAGGARDWSPTARRMRADTRSRSWRISSRAGPAP